MVQPFLNWISSRPSAVLMPFGAMNFFKALDSTSCTISRNVSVEVFWSCEVYMTEPL